MEKVCQFWHQIWTSLKTQTRAWKPLRFYRQPRTNTKLGWEKRMGFTNGHHAWGLDKRSRLWAASGLEHHCILRTCQWFVGQKHLELCMPWESELNGSFQTSQKPAAEKLQAGKWVLFLCCLFWDRVSYIPDYPKWPWNHGPPVPISQVWGS